MEKKNVSKKVSCSDLVKYQCEAAKENYKRALASYVQFLIRDKFYCVRENLHAFINQSFNEVCDMIDFDKK